MTTRTPANRDDDGADGASAVPQIAGVTGALAGAFVTQRRNEAKRPRLQQWVGAFPHRRAQEDFAVRAGALAAGTVAHVLVAGAMAGMRQHRDRKAQIAGARMICQVIGVAARTPDGSVSADGRVVLELALKGTGLGSRTCKRLMAEPPPMTIDDLEPYPLQGELLEAIPAIAFNAMAEATGPDEAVRRVPALLRRLGLPRPTAQAMAESLLEEYNSERMMLSDYYARLMSPAPGRSLRLDLPLSGITAVTETVIARNPSELARRDSRQAAATLLRRGVRATLTSGVRLNPAVLTGVRILGQLSGEKVPARPGQITSSAHGDVRPITSAQAGAKPQEKPQ